VARIIVFTGHNSEKVTGRRSQIKQAVNMTTIEDKKQKQKYTSWGRPLMSDLNQINTRVKFRVYLIFLF
jgi:hypothetical protein